MNHVDRSVKSPLKVRSHFAGRSTKLIAVHPTDGDEESASIGVYRRQSERSQTRK